MLRVRSIVVLWCVFFLFGGVAEAAGANAFIVRGTITEIVSQGRVSDYKLKLADGDVVLLKSPDMELTIGQNVAFFVRPGAKEGGLTTYLPINFPSRVQPSHFADGRAVIQVANGSFMMFDKQGRSVGKQYAKMRPFYEGLASVQVREANHAWGFVDTNGNMVIEPKFVGYDPYYYFHNGFAIVDGQGYIDKKGTLAVFPQNRGWSPLTPFSEGLAFVLYGTGAKNGDIHIIDEKGVILNEKPLLNDRMAVMKSPCLAFSEGLAAVRIGDAWGFIDRTGTFVIEPEYKNIRSFSEGYAAVQNTEDRWGYIDKDGNWVVNATYAEAYSFSDGLASVRLGGGWGFVDANGELVIKANYSKVGYFSEGVAPASYSERHGSAKWGLIDKKGNWVLEPKYDSAHNLEGYTFDIPRFSDDLLLVSEFFSTKSGTFGSGGRRYAWIDRSGKETLILFMHNRW